MSHRTSYSATATTKTQIAPPNHAGCTGSYKSPTNQSIFNDMRPFWPWKSSYHRWRTVWKLKIYGLWKYSPTTAVPILQSGYILRSRKQKWFNVLINCFLSCSGFVLIMLVFALRSLSSFYTKFCFFCDWFLIRARSAVHTTLYWVLDDVNGIPFYMPYVHRKISSWKISATVITIKYATATPCTPKHLHATTGPDRQERLAVPDERLFSFGVASIGIRRCIQDFCLLRLLKMLSHCWYA